MKRPNTGGTTSLVEFFMGLMSTRRATAAITVAGLPARLAEIKAAHAACCAGVEQYAQATCDGRIYLQTELAKLERDSGQ